jgi:hypothetical protein
MAAVQAKVEVDKTFIIKPIIPGVDTVIASTSEETTVTAKADTGPEIKPKITIIISLGSYFKNSTEEMGILIKTVRTYANALNKPSIANRFVFVFIATSQIENKKSPLGAI